MSGLRSVEDQFEPKQAKRIRELAARVDDLRWTVSGGALRYYLAELRSTLEAGALLGSLHLCVAILELFVRALIIEYVGSVASVPPPSFDEPTYQEQLEENRKLRFGELLDFLVSAELFHPADAQAAKDYYQSVRTPLTHGLLERYINGRPDEADNLYRLLGPKQFTGMRSIEDAIEDNALDQIATLVGIVERNIDARMANA